MAANDPMKDPLAFGRQLWQQWNEAVQAASPAAKPALPDWSAALSQWRELTGTGDVDLRRATEKLGLHGLPFFDFMQGLAQRSAGGMPDATDVADLWRKLMAGEGNPMLDALRQASAEGARGFEQLFDAVKGALGPARSEWSAWTQLPGFGLGRERQAQLGAIVRAQAAHAEAVQAYQRLLAKASELGMERFESKLGERSEPGRQLESMRALYDLWIDAAEEAYAQVALSPEFQDAYGELVNSQMRLRRLQQKEVERAAAEFGMPTRSELDGVLRRLHELQREVRALRAANAASPTPPVAGGSSRSTAARPAAKAKSSPAKKPRAANSKTAVKPTPRRRAR